MVLDGEVLRAEREHKARAWHAWHTAALVGRAFAGKLPPLSELLGPTKPAERRSVSWQEQKRQVMMINTLLGGDVVERQPAA